MTLKHKNKSAWVKGMLSRKQIDTDTRLDPGYEGISVRGTRVLDPGYEGIRSGVRGY